MKKRTVPLALLFFAVCFSSSPVWAAFSISVTPSVTRNDIHFGEVEEGDIVTEEAEINVTNDTSVRYQLTHFLIRSLQNEEGDLLNPEQIRFFIRGANLGTMQVEAPSALQPGSVTLYTSDETGTSDTMTIAYTLFVPEKVKGGMYRGQVTFNLEPLTASGSASLQSVTLEISAQIRTVFQLAISSQSEQERLDFGKISLDQSEAVQELLFEVLSNIGSGYQIEQRFVTALTNVQNGQTVPFEKLAVNLSGGARGTLSPQALLSQEPAVIYRSDSSGSSDSWIAAYHLEGAASLPAGQYQGMLSVSVKSDTTLPATAQTAYSIPVSLEVESVFDFVVTPVEGGSLQFKDVKPDESAESQLVVQIRNNTGQRYQFQLLVTEPLANEQGEQIPEGNFTVRLERVTTGDAAAGDYQPVKVGTAVLYTSNDQGESDVFNLTCRLTVPKKSKGGTYRTQLSFALLVI